MPGLLTDRKNKKAFIFRISISFDRFLTKEILKGNFDMIKL